MLGFFEVNGAASEASPVLTCMVNAPNIKAKLYRGGGGGGRRSLLERTS